MLVLVIAVDCSDARSDAPSRAFSLPGCLLFQPCEDGPVLGIGKQYVVCGCLVLSLAGSWTTAVKVFSNKDVWP